MPAAADCDTPRPTGHNAPSDRAYTIGVDLVSSMPARQSWSSETRSNRPIARTHALHVRPRLQGDDLTGDDPDSFRQLSALDRQTSADVVSDVHALQDDLARMHRDVATRDGRAAARRNAQAYNAYDTFADTVWYKIRSRARA